MTLQYAEEARENIRDIYSALYDLSPTYADKWTDELVKKTELLLSFPEMGRMVPEPEIKSIREIFVGRYRVIYQYRPEETKIYVMAIRPMLGLLGKI